MKTICIIPIWFINVVLRPWLPFNHPLKRYKSIGNWSENATPVAVFAGFGIWWSILCITFVYFTVIRRLTH